MSGVPKQVLVRIDPGHILRGARDIGEATVFTVQYSALNQGAPGSETTGRRRPGCLFQQLYAEPGQALQSRRRKLAQAKLFIIRLQFLYHRSRLSEIVQTQAMRSNRISIIRSLQESNTTT